MVKRNDRWSALSMSDRADLIKLYVSNGITSLNDIKKDYNSFGDGGDTNDNKNTKGYTTTNNEELQDLETFNSNWYKYRDSQLASIVKSDPSPQHITRGLNFWQTSFPMFVDDAKLASGARNYMDERLKHLKEFTLKEAVKDKQARQVLIDDYYKYFPSERKENEVEIGPPKSPDDYSLIRLQELIRKGGYSRPAHIALYSAGYENTSTKIHERAHAAIPKTAISHHPILKPIKNVFLQKDVKASNYYDDIGEIYSRLMQMRFENKIDPSHKYTLEEVKAMRDNSNFKDFNIFNRYTDDSILMLLNDVAQNTTDYNKLNYINPDNIAANGGELNSFDGGGDIQVELPDNIVKRLAYLIGSDYSVSSKGYASWDDIKRILSGKGGYPEFDDDKATFIFGNILGLPPAEGSNGKDYSKYLKDKYPLKYLLGKINEYQGVINPYNSYVIDERDRGLVEELAKKGKGVYLNADSEYSYMADIYDPSPYRNDVAGYHAQFVNTPNGYAISASDLYDFGPDYTGEKYSGEMSTKDKILTGIESAALGFVGNPYILRQDNIPIEFINANDATWVEDKKDRIEGFNYALKYGMLSDKDRAEGVTLDEKLAKVLETGYIEPAVVTTEVKKANGGKIKKFDTGENKTTTVSPLSFTDVMLKTAKARAKAKTPEKLLLPNTKVITDSKGNEFLVRTEEPIQDMTSNIMEWAPGVGDVYELGLIKKDFNQGNYGSAALGAGLFFIPGNIRKLIDKGKNLLGLNSRKVAKSATEKVEALLKRFPKRMDSSSPFSESLRERLLKEGVDPRLLTDDNLRKMTYLRSQDILESATPSKFAARESSSGTNLYNLYNNIDGSVTQVGYISAVPNPKEKSGRISMIENVTLGTKKPVKGVSELGYNTVIKELGASENGRVLLHPESTIPVLNKYKDKNVIGNYGVWYIDGSPTLGNPVYRLNTPTYDVPIKYLDDFSVEGLDDSGMFLFDFTKGPLFKNGGKLNKN